MTVSELLNKISSYELTEWAAYYDIKNKRAKKEYKRHQREAKGVK